MTRYLKSILYQRLYRSSNKSCSDIIYNIYTHTHTTLMTFKKSTSPQRMCLFVCLGFLISGNTSKIFPDCLKSTFQFLGLLSQSGLLDPLFEKPTPNLICAGIQIVEIEGIYCLSSAPSTRPLLEHHSYSCHPISRAAHDLLL